jgi:hypothetical protein
MKAILKRHQADEVQTLGQLFILEDNDMPLGSFMTLELPWRNNERRVSCIPAGKYELHPHYSPRFGKCLWVKMPGGDPTVTGGRTGILVHKGNYYSEILGCILPGLILMDINKDGYKDVKYSAPAMTAICDLITDVTPFEII